MVLPPEGPVFVLVPGGFCLASLYHKVTERLKGRGYVAVEVDHPTVFHTDKALKTFYDDAEQVRSAASGLMDQGEDVIVVGNSYGGIVVTEAAKGLSKAERNAAGKFGGALTHMVLFGSLLSPLGTSLTQLTAGKVEVVNDSEDVLLDPPPPEVAGAMFMNDLPYEDQLRYGRQFRSQASAAFHGKLTHQGFLHIPTTYVVTENDKSLSPELQHESIDSILASSEGNIRKRSIQSDHCSMISHPDELVKILLEASSQVAN